MVDPSAIISKLIAGTQKLQELYANQETNAIDRKDHMDNLEKNLKTLESLQDRLRNQLMTLNKTDMEKWTDKSNKVQHSLAESTLRIYERKGQSWIDKVLCSARQTSDIRNSVRQFNNTFQDFNNFLKSIVDSEKVYYLQQTAENTVIITLPFQT